MALERTDAVILKSFEFGDTSRIARCYTRDFGKISLIAKGVRKSKFLQSSYLESLSFVELFFYQNPKRELQIFSKAVFQKLWKHMRSDIRRMTYGFAVVELTDRSVTGEEPHSELFRLLVDVLDQINESNGNLNIIFWYFEIQLLTLLGFRPFLSECPRCRRTLKRGIFSYGYGEILCQTCYDESKGHPESASFRKRAYGDQKSLERSSRKDAWVVSSSAMEVLKKLKIRPIEEIDDIMVTPAQRKQIGGFLNRYLTYHIEGLRQINSLSVMEKILS